MTMIQNKIQSQKYTFKAAALIVCAIGLRLFLIAHNWPVTDSEEGTMGLEALHIAFRGEHPIYLYGQNYMGVAEAYLGSLLFRFFGVSVFSLRSGMLLLFSVFLILVYFLGKLLYGRRVACFTLLLLIGGTENVLTPQMKAVGGVAETLVCGTLVMVLAAWLALSNVKEIYATKLKIWKRTLAYSGWGLTAGLGLWSHSLVVPFIFGGAILLLFFCRCELWTKMGFFLVLGFIIGSLPLIIYNVTAPLANNSLAVLIGLHHTYYPNAPTGVTLWLKQLSGTFLYTLPIATGLPQIISNTVLPLYSPLQVQFLLPILLYGGWSLGYVALLMYSTKYSFKSMRLYWYKAKANVETNAWAIQKEIRLHACRFIVLATAWLTLASYAMSSTAAQRPWSFRYLTGLLIVLPALIAPLIENKDWINKVRPKIWRIVTKLVLILILSVYLVGTIQSISMYPLGNHRLQQQHELIESLLKRGITRIYSGYWVCDRLIFQSQEKIICAVVNEEMQPGLTRYLPYRDVVDHDQDAAYVFTQNGDFHPEKVIEQFSADSNYTKININEYIVFIKRDM